MCHEKNMKKENTFFVSWFYHFSTDRVIKIIVRDGRNEKNNALFCFSFFFLFLS